MGLQAGAGVSATRDRSHASLVTTILTGLATHTSLAGTDNCETSSTIEVVAEPRLCPNWATRLMRKQEQGGHQRWWVGIMRAARPWDSS